MRTRLVPERTADPTRIYMTTGDREWVFVGYVNELEIEQEDWIDGWYDGPALRITKPQKTLTLSIDLKEMFIKDLVPAEEVSPVGVEIVPEVEEVPAVVEEVHSDIPTDWKVL